MHALKELKIPVGAGTPGMHHASGDSLPVEMRQLPDQVDILEKHRATLPGSGEIPVVSNRNAMLCREGFSGHDVCTIR